MGIALETAHSADLNLTLAKEVAVAAKKSSKIGPKSANHQALRLFLVVHLLR